MQLNERDKAYLWDISEACKDILEFIEGIKFEEFSKDKMRQYAIERQLLVIGEAANHLSKDFIKETTYIPWKNIIGMRNIIAHDYGEILLERIWITAVNHIQTLLVNISQFISEKGD